MYKLLSGITVSLLLLLCGCAVENNHLNPNDFADCLRRNDIKVDDVHPILPEQIKATSACAVRVNGSEIGVFKYDVSSNVQRKRLERIAQTRKVYFIGMPFYAYVHGSFVFIGLEKCPQKHEVIKAIKKFR